MTRQELLDLADKHIRAAEVLLDMAKALESDRHAHALETDVPRGAKRVGMAQTRVSPKLAKAKKRVPA